jgi:sigma-B regulation protein RsbU (phosphoserine phosphatase)
LPPIRPPSTLSNPAIALVLYTDGVLEAANATGEEFGSHRLSALLKDGARLNPQAAADHIISSLQTWSRFQNDDLTVLICDYAGIQMACNRIPP